MNISYHHINRLGLKIYNEPISHILSEDLTKAMSKADRKKFSEYFGIRTCFSVEGKVALYPWDVEGVLEEMDKNKLNYA